MLEGPDVVQPMGVKNVWAEVRYERSDLLPVLRDPVRNLRFRREVGFRKSDHEHVVYPADGLDLTQDIRLRKLRVLPQKVGDARPYDSGRGWKGVIRTCHVSPFANRRVTGH